MWLKFKYLIILLLAFCSKFSFAQEATVTAKIDKKTFLIGEQTLLHFEVQQPINAVILWPKIQDTLSEHVEVISFQKADTFKLETGIIRIDLQYLITSFDSGRWAIPPQIFQFQITGDTQKVDLATDSLFIDVQNVTVDLQKEINDIKPILDEPKTWRDYLPYFLWTLLALAMAALGYYIYKRLKNKQPLLPLPKKPALPAHLLALQKLDKLSAMKLWQQGDPKEFYSQLTDILREYMEKRFQFAAMEMVSSDIILHLEKIAISKDLKEQSAKVLRAADYVKFAKSQPLADENDLAMRWGYVFVNETKPTEEKEVTA